MCINSLLSTPVYFNAGNLAFENEESEDTTADAPPAPAAGADPAKQAAPAYSGSTTVVHPYLSSFGSKSSEI